jgi:hypothetical protein
MKMEDFPRHPSPRLVIPAHAGIQVVSAQISLDTRFRGYDGSCGYLAHSGFFIPQVIHARVFSKEHTKTTKVSYSALRAMPQR